MLRKSYLDLWNDEKLSLINISNGAGNGVDYLKFKDLDHLIEFSNGAQSVQKVLSTKVSGKPHTMNHKYPILRLNSSYR